jgi:zinc transporter
MVTEHVDIVSGAPASGIVWVYRFNDDGIAASFACEKVDQALAAEGGGWTWIHIGLADTRGRAWVAQHAPVSDIARELLTGPDEHMRLDILGGEVVGVLPDLQQEFARPTEDLVRLRFVMTDRMLITARRRPVHSLELTRRTIDAGRRFPTAISFLDAIVDQFADGISRVAEKIGDQLDEVENRLLRDEDVADERTSLGRIRLQSVRMHRQLAQLRTLFHRLEPRVAAENRQVARAIRTLAQKLDALDHDVAAQHERARLLLDEVAGMMAAITNRRLFTLSVLTACLLPPTLVTGFFGMNTKDLPFQNTDGGTWYALTVAAIAGVFAIWVLKRLRAL